MNACRVVMAEDGRTVLGRARVALRLWAKARGLMFRKALPAGEGLLIPGCRSIHTCFMRFRIDVIYLATGDRVAKIVEAMKPYRISYCLRARSVLEMPAGWVRQTKLKVGDSLVLGPIEAGD